MQVLILVDGMSGAGKSSVATLLAKQLPRTAVVGFDKIKKFVSDFERGTRDNQIAREITQVMVQKYLDLGLSVLIEQPFKDEEEIDWYTEIAKEHSVQIYKFQLFAHPEIALQRVVERTKRNNGDLPEDRARRNIALFQSREHLNFKVIDTTNIDPETVAKIILEDIAV